MKKALFIVILLLLTLTAMSSLSFAEVDTTTSATTEPAPTAPTAPAPKAPAPAPAVKQAADTTKLANGTVYTVVNGDAFWKVAKKYNLTIDQLAKLNPQVKNINKIYVGQKLSVATAAPVAKATSPVVAAKKLFHGFGEATNYRVRGAQKDNVNITTASAIFDQDGKIVNVTFDVMEITYALFPGWLDPEADQATKDAFVASIDGKWHTKREEGYDYDMTHLKSKGAADNLSKNEWFVQLDYFESFFKGMTVAEVEAWFNKYTDVNGRPYKMAYPDKLTDTDKTATANFTAAEKAMLVDVTTSATMSLQDPHSHFITALKEAYNAREEIK